VRIAGVFAGIVLAVAPGPARASDIRFHKELTDQVLRQRGWTDPEAIREVARANMATDLARLPAHAQDLLRALAPRTEDSAAEVLRLAATVPFNPQGTDSLHFNSLYTYDAVVLRWTEFGTWVDAHGRELATRGLPGSQTRAFLGVVMHSVQDFYEHANWFTILDRFAPPGMKRGDYPLWEDLVDDRGGWREAHPAFDSAGALNRLRASNAFLSETEELGGLQTGRTRYEHWTTRPKPWMHRHQFGEHRREVEEISTRAMNLWLDRIDVAMGLEGDRALW